ncbi:MAG: hypothetical protein QXQ88_01395 [archaeon]
MKAGFDVLRLVSGQKDPANLEIELENNDDISQMVSVAVRIPFSFGFDLVGLEREKIIKVGEIQPKEVKRIVVPIFPKPSVRPGEYEFVTKMRVHPGGRWDKVAYEEQLKTFLRVIKT